MMKTLTKKQLSDELLLNTLYKRLNHNLRESNINNCKICEAYYRICFELDRKNKIYPKNMFERKITNINHIPRNP